MKRKEKYESETGFEGWGDYMDAKIAKLEGQFRHSASTVGEKQSNLFAGVSIFVNGYTNPSADELKRIMMLHGGVFHHYKRPNTTYTIASILPDVKIRSITSELIISPRWVVDCLRDGRLLDYSRYLLYSNSKPTQPKLAFAKLPPSSVVDVAKPVPKNDGNTNDISHAECLNVLGMLKCFSDPPRENPPEVVQQEQIEVPAEHGNNPPEIITEKSPTTNGQAKETDFLGSPDVFSEDDPPSTMQRSFEEVRNGTTSKTPPRPPASSKQSLTATDPNFLKEFFNNSRLHHIATLGASFKQYVAELREKSSGTFPARATLVEQLQSHPEDAAHEFSNATNGNARQIMHIDMDCFFVSVGLRNHPHLRGLPVAVTHSRGSAAHVPSHPGQDRAREIELYHKRLQERNKTPDIPMESRLSAIDDKNSLSEIASCSYEARRCGVKNGMFVGAALKLCPELKTIPYDFDGYREVAHQLYDTIAQYTLDIEAVSCDEMFVDLTELTRTTGVNVMNFVTSVRRQISTSTGCACSAGIGANRLQARMATKKAKPNGQFQLLPAAVEEYMHEIPIADLPGVGPSTSHRLKQMTYVTCADLQTIPRNTLQTEFGKKFGETLYNACRGIDERPLVYDRGRKSVSVDVNYGIRFSTDQEVDRFMRQLTEEIHRRLVELRQRGKLITVKLLVRSPEAPIETAKFMGHGLCDVVTKSHPLRQHTDDRTMIETTVLDLMRIMAIEPRELRGIGIQISKFEGSKNGTESAAGNRLKRMFKKVEKKQELPPTEPAKIVAPVQTEKSVTRNEEIYRSPFKQPDDQQPCSSKSLQAIVQPNPQPTEVIGFATPTKTNVRVAPIISPSRYANPAQSPSKKRTRVTKSSTGSKRGRPPKAATKSVGRKESTHGLRKFLTTVETKGTSHIDESEELPPELDPLVLAALPEDIREEAVRDFRRHQKLLQSSHNMMHLVSANEKTPVKKSPQTKDRRRDWNSPVTPQLSSTVDEQKIKVELKFLQALPPELRLEVEKQIVLNRGQMVVTCSDEEIDEPLIVSPESSPVKERTPSKGSVEVATVQNVVESPSKDPNILRRGNWRELIEEWLHSSAEPYEYDIQLLAANGQELCLNESLERLYLFLRYFQRLVKESRECHWHRAYEQVLFSIQEQMTNVYGKPLAIRNDIACEMCNKPI